MKMIGICGIGGVGKTTVLEEVMELYPDFFHKKVSYTTREPRPGEIDGKDYHFIEHNDLIEKAFEGDILEVTEFQGEIYATSIEKLSKDKINIGIFSPEGMFALDGALNGEGLGSFIPILITTDERTAFCRMMERDKHSSLDNIINRYKEDKKQFMNIMEIDNLITVSNESPEDIQKIVSLIKLLGNSLK